MFEKDASKLSSIFISGSIAGIINSFVVSPVEFCRTQAVVSNTSTLFQLTRLTPAHLFRCLIPTMLRDGPGLGFYFLMFQSIRGSSDGNTSHSYPLTTTVLAGCASGIAYWAWALPVDTFKTRMESFYYSHPGSSTQSLAKMTLRSFSLKVGGAWQLYQAWPYAYGRGIPAAVITLTTYDCCLKWLES